VGTLRCSICSHDPFLRCKTLQTACIRGAWAVRRADAHRHKNRSRRVSCLSAIREGASAIWTTKLTETALPGLNCHQKQGLLLIESVRTTGTEALNVQRRNAQVPLRMQIHDRYHGMLRRFPSRGSTGTGCGTSLVVLDRQWVRSLANALRIPWTGNF
jgi:hypothetical protein